MKKPTSANFILACCLLFAFTAKAQQQILQSSIDKITNSPGISYKVSEINNDPFGGSDQHSEIKVAQSNRLGDNNYESYVVDCEASYGKFKYVGNSKQQLELYLKDSIYVMKPRGTDKSYADPLNFLVTDLKRKINETRYTTQMFSDTIINKGECYHLFIEWENTSKKLYDRIHVFINKRDNMILGVISDQKGEMSKGGISLGTIRMTRQASFSDYKFSAKEPGPKDFSVPSGFRPEQKALPLLGKGTTAPGWELTSTEGKKLSLADLKGKVVFVEFFSNGCAAAALAVPSMKKLNAKYDGTDVVILTINTQDSKDEVLNFISKKDIKAPVYLNGKSVAKAYNVHSDPNFYLINKQGEVHWSSEGYFEDFDNKVTATIEAIR
ncbi:TlpA family protein disulfide reductase [Mucilaginibacter sp. UYCu711]|uniref:TlpA family protein disulfide reductase n=1 Tax=Mucilaginibacter sp. UYCu711 TaxID=3156339 RepID=UPI003D1B674E